MKHKRLLEAIFKTPVQSNVVREDIESLLAHLDVEITEGEWSRLRLALNGVCATLHRLHPKKRARQRHIGILRGFPSKKSGTCTIRTTG